MLRWPERESGHVLTASEAIPTKRKQEETAQIPPGLTLSLHTVLPELAEGGSWLQGSTEGRQPRSSPLYSAAYRRLRPRSWEAAQLPTRLQHTGQKTLEIQLQTTRCLHFQVTAGKTKG